MDDDFIELLRLVFDNPTLEDWILFVRQDTAFYLKLANIVWSPIFNENELYRLYTWAICPLRPEPLQWLLENHALHHKTSVLALCLIMLRTPSELYQNTKEMAEAVRLILKSGRSLFRETEYKAFIFSLLCEPSLINVSHYIAYKNEFGALVDYPIDVNLLARYERQKVYNDIAALARHPDNYGRISLLFSLLTIQADDIAEIIFRIKGRAPGCKGSILPTLRFLVTQYMYYTDTYELPANFCILDYHAHDSESFSYLIKVLNNPIIDITKCVKKVVRGTNTITEFKACLNHFGWPVDFLIRNITPLYREEIPASDDKLSYILSRCNKDQIELVRYLYDFVSDDPEPTRKYFYYLLFKHYETIVKLVKKRLFRKHISNWCRKCHTLCQLSITPDGVFGENYYFPGGTIYWEIMGNIQQLCKDVNGCKT